MGITQQDELVTKLEEKMTAASEKIDEAWLGWIMSSEEVAQNAEGWSGALGGDIKTLGMLWQSMEEGAEKQKLYDYMVELATAARNLTKDTKEYEEVLSRILYLEGLQEDVKTLDSQSGADAEAVTAAQDR